MVRGESASVARTDPKPSIPTVREDQVDAVIALWKPLVEAVGATVGPHCEVVLHDLRTPESSIVAIWNGTVTGRRIGGPVVGGPTKDVALRLLDMTVAESVLSVGYKTETRDGRQLRSTSLVLRTPSGKPVVAFCVNVDLSAIAMARAFLDEISKIAPANGEVSPESAQTEVSDVVAQIIQETLAQTGKLPKLMDREDRLRAVKMMHERGLFLIRGGVERAADALGISRFTLYGYLKEIRAAGTS